MPPRTERPCRSTSPEVAPRLLATLSLLFPSTVILSEDQEVGSQGWVQMALWLLCHASLWLECSLHKVYPSSSCYRAGG